MFKTTGVVTPFTTRDKIKINQFNEKFSLNFIIIYRNHGN